MKIEIVSSDRLQKSLQVADLSDPNNGSHVISIIVEEIHKCLSGQKNWPKPEINRGSPIVSVMDNYDRLRFPLDNASRSSRYTRYVSKDSLLRTHTSAMMPAVLDSIKLRGLDDHLVLCPGICYRRDVVDSTHCGEPHQMDVWRTKKGEPRLDRASLLELIDVVISHTLPGFKYRTNEVEHPYTINGLEVEILKRNGDWLELLECGETHPEVLRNSGLDPDEYSGLAMGVGLDRLAMLIKDIDDIRILRSTDERISKQMQDMARYKPVSKYPCVRQDISVSVPVETTEEDICEVVNDTLGHDFSMVEEVKIVSETQYEQLPPQAISRLGIKPGQKNLLIKIVFRLHERTLTQQEANEARDKLYMAVDRSDTGGYLAKGD